MIRPTPLKLTVVAFAASIAFTSCRKAVDLAPALEQEAALTQIPPSNSNRTGFVPNEVIVKFKAGHSGRSLSSALDLVGGTITEQIQPTPFDGEIGSESFYVIHTPLAVQKAINILLADDRIESAEPNQYVQLANVPNDTAYKRQWSLWNPTATTYEIGILTAWTKGTGASILNSAPTVYVGIVDEGIMNTHTDLAPNYPGLVRETAGNRIDDDRNGIVDDRFGRDFVANDNTIFDGLIDDHGTAVAGVIGARSNNITGIAGINWTVGLIGAKFVGSTGGTTANAARALLYMATLRRIGVPVVAVNCSWTYRGSAASAVNAAIDSLLKHDVLLVTAVGNDSVEIESTILSSAGPIYPAAHKQSNIIRVASIERNGTLSSFSNYSLSFVDLGAPGSGILTTVPVGTKTAAPGYRIMRGTSMAAAHVTGAIALMKAIDRTATGATLKTRLLTLARKTPALVNKTGPNGATLDLSGL